MTHKCSVAFAARTGVARKAAVGRVELAVRWVLLSLTLAPAAAQALSTPSRCGMRFRPGRRLGRRQVHRRCRFPAKPCGRSASASAHQPAAGATPTWTAQTTEPAQAPASQRPAATQPPPVPHPGPSICRSLWPQWLLQPSCFQTQLRQRRAATEGTRALRAARATQAAATAWLQQRLRRVQRQAAKVRCARVCSLPPPPPAGSACCRPAVLQQRLQPQQLQAEPLPSLQLPPWQHLQDWHHGAAPSGARAAPHCAPPRARRERVAPLPHRPAAARARSHLPPHRPLPLLAAEESRTCA